MKMGIRVKARYENEVLKIGICYLFTNEGIYKEDK